LGLVVIVEIFLAYRLAQSALRTKGDVDVEMSRGKTVFKLKAKERKSENSERVVRIRRPAETAVTQLEGAAAQQQVLESKASSTER
jgi:hypothetical protein